MGFKSEAKILLNEKFGDRKEHPPLPTFIQVEHTTYCNFNCVVCSRKTLGKNRINKNMTLNEFKGILKSFPNLNSINLTGFGEAYLNPYLLQMLQYCKSKNIYTLIGTNGSLVDKHLDTLPYLDRIGFSLDSSNQATFEKIRLGSSFQKVLDNIKLVIDEREKNKYRLDITLNSVICHLNYNEIVSLTKLADSLGIKQIGFGEAENWEIKGEVGYPAEREFIMKAREMSEEIRMQIEIAKEAYPSMNIIYVSSAKQKLTCKWPFIWTLITVDGFVVPCCRRLNPEVFNFGNIFETSFEEIWNSKKYVDFRKSLSRNLKNPICDECPD